MKNESIEIDLIGEIKKQFPKWDKHGSIVLIKDFGCILPITSDNALNICKAINSVTYDNRIYRIRSFNDYRIMLPHHYKKPHSFFIDLTHKNWLVKKGSLSLAAKIKPFLSIHRSFNRTLYVFVNKKSYDGFQKIVEANCDLEIAVNLMGNTVIVLNNYK